MEHPFVKDLETKTLDEVQKTMSDLMQKLNFAYRTGNQPLINQLLMAYESYKKEHARKLDELIKKQNIGSRISIKKEGEA